MLFADGYAVLERFIGSDEIPRLRAETDNCVRLSQGPSCERPNNTLVPLRWDHAIVRHVLGEEDRVSRLRHVADARDLRFVSGYISLKDPYSPALSWHQDWWCWDHPVSFAARPVQVAVLCYLEKTRIRNAALRVLPGSHHRSTPLHALLPEAHATEAGALAATHPAMSDQAGQVTLPLEAGDAVVIDYRLLHGTHANATPVPRHCVLLTFTPSWHSLPEDLRGHLIRHPALPSDGEPASDRLLPSYAGPRRDLALSREAPREFAIVS